MQVKEKPRFHPVNLFSKISQRVIPKKSLVILWKVVV
jgi:hypothetical protein